MYKMNLREILCGKMPTDFEERAKYMEKSKVYHDALNNFKKKKLESILKMEYDLGKLGQKMKDIKEYEKVCRYDLKEATAVEHNNGYSFVTINPNDTTTLTEFEEKLKKFVNRNMFIKYRYVIEQRGSTEKDMGKGFHAHVLLKRNLDYKPSKIVVNTKNTFKGITNVDNNQVLNIQHIGEDFAKDKDDYMTGVKTGEGKDEKQAIDKIFRKKNNLESVYGQPFFEK